MVVAQSAHKGVHHCVGVGMAKSAAMQVGGGSLLRTQESCYSVRLSLSHFSFVSSRQAEYLLNSAVSSSSSGVCKGSQVIDESD